MDPYRPPSVANMLASAGATGDDAANEAPSGEDPSRPRIGEWLRNKLRIRPAKDADASRRLDDFLETEAQNGHGRTHDERALLENVLSLRDLRVDDVMVPRADIVAVEVSASFEETLEIFREGSHSRIPVYRETLDDPVGVVHLKDLALGVGLRDGDEPFSLARYMRPTLIVPPSMRVQVLLQRMRATRRHMALVIDEYGGVDGLVTIEDVIEQIVGEIEDEHDDAEGPLWVEQAPGCYLAEARAELDEFEAVAGVKLLSADDEEEIDTLGGAVFMMIGRVPVRGEVVFHPDGHEIEIVDADPRKIKRLRIRLAGETPANLAPTEDAAAEAAAAAEATLDGAQAGPLGEASADADSLDSSGPDSSGPDSSGLDAGEPDSDRLHAQGESIADEPAAPSDPPLSGARSIDPDSDARRRDRSAPRPADSAAAEPARRSGASTG